MPTPQEWLSLGLVAAIVAAYARWRRRRRAGNCGDCASAGPPPKENVIRFYRRSDAPGNGHNEDATVSREPRNG